MNNPGNSVLNEAGGSKEKKAGVFPIRYIAVLGFQREDVVIDGTYRAVSIHYIAVLGFQLAKTALALVSQQFQSAISRYLVSNWPETKKCPLAIS